MTDPKPESVLNSWPELNLPDFIETLSSELRRPLTPILSVPDLMLKDGAGQLSADQRQLLEVLRLNGRRMLQIVEDLVTIGQIAGLRTSDEPLRFETVELAELIGTVVERFQPELEHGQVTLSCDVASDLPPIEASRVALEAVLASLLSNAVRSTRAQGCVTLAVRRSGGDEIAIEIADSGTGLARELQHKLFPPMLTGHNPLWYWAVSPGLYIIKSFVDLHNGEVDVCGEVETGNVITVTLPIRQGN